jgi:hypothetical protein
MTASLSRGQRDVPRSTERQRQAAEHRQVGVKLNPRQSTDSKRYETGAVFQVPERTLNGSTAPVQVFEPLAVSGDARKEATAESERQGRLTSPSPWVSAGEVGSVKVGIGPLAETLASATRRRRARQRERPLSGAFPLADDGTRTHDLLHGKQTL